MRELPDRPSLEQLKTQAKDLLRAHQDRQVQACGPLGSLARFAGSDEGQILDVRVTLTETKEAIALQYGFHSWEALRSHVVSLNHDGRSRGLDVPDRLLERWQSSIDGIARMARIPAALVMRVVDEEIEVFLRSCGDENPYSPGDREHLIGSGLYCETVIKRREKLHVVDALADPAWSQNPDVKLEMIAYLGLPLLMPNGEAFGTICVLDRRANTFSEGITELLASAKSMIEAHLELLTVNQQLRLRNEQLQKSIEEIRQLHHVLQICSFCKRIRTKEGQWQEVGQLFDEDGVQFSHGICPNCFGVRYPQAEEGNWGD